jgi:dsDNA-specific endonuclease/ATPase MutS2
LQLARQEQERARTPARSLETVNRTSFLLDHIRRVPIDIEQQWRRVAESAVGLQRLYVQEEMNVDHSGF